MSDFLERQTFWSETFLETGTYLGKWDNFEKNILENETVMENELFFRNWDILGNWDIFRKWDNFEKIF